MNFRILKRDNKFFIQHKILFLFWIDLKENNNPAFDQDCPPFEDFETAKHWLAVYVEFHTPVIMPVHKNAII